MRKRKKHSHKVVHEMIARNVLHYRPRSGFARDLDPVPSSAVVTPTGQPALRAMERLLVQEGSN